MNGLVKSVSRGFDKIFGTQLGGSGAGRSGDIAKEKAKGDVVNQPAADDEAVQRAKQRALASQLSRSGRASTVLAPTGERLGP